MKWEFLFDENENILFAKIHGVLNMADNTVMIKESLEPIEKRKCHRLLVDYIEIESQEIGTFDIYSIPKLFTELGVPRNLRIADVMPKIYGKDFGFFETVCRNSGYFVSIFLDVESAL